MAMGMCDTFMTISDSIAVVDHRLDGCRDGVAEGISVSHMSMATQMSLSAFSGGSPSATRTLGDVRAQESS